MSDAIRDDRSPRTVLVIGSSDGIGLALVRVLLARGDRVVGVSRSVFPSQRLVLPGDVASRYRHLVADVRDGDWREKLGALCDELGDIDACVYCAGIGDPLDLAATEALGGESETFEVNLVGLVRTVEVVVARMLERGAGHLVGLSSLADAFPDGGAPAYGASKAGVSAYLERLGLALRPRGVFVTNLRFGFVDTKMAKSPVKPFMITPEAAAARVLRCLDRRPRRDSYPWVMAALLWFAVWPNRLRLRLG